MWELVAQFWLTSSFYQGIITSQHASFLSSSSKQVTKQTSSAAQIKASLQDKQTNSMCQLQGTMHIRRSTVPSGPITKIPCNYVVTREWDMFLEPGTDFLQSPS
jgi:hypothetical protein